MRLFIAVPIPEDLRNCIYRDAVLLKREGIAGSYPVKENYHITLKFLGEVDDERARRILPLLRDRFSGFSSFTVEVEGRGVFPGFANPKVVWCGVGEGSDGLRKMHGIVEEAMDELGFERDDREFHPHITLGRLKRLNAQQKRFIREFCAATVKHGRFTVERITLYKSVLAPSGAKYYPLGSVELGR